MSTTTLLFNGYLWIVPVSLGLALTAVWCAAYYVGKQRDWKVAKRTRLLRTGRALIQVLPLSGVLGTVWGLINTLSFMGTQANGKMDMPKVVERFAVALNTTLWGVLFACLTLVLYQVALSELEGDEDE